MTREQEVEADAKFHGERCNARRAVNTPWPKESRETDPGFSTRDGETARRVQ